MKNIARLALVVVVLGAAAGGAGCASSSKSSPPAGAMASATGSGSSRADAGSNSTAWPAKPSARASEHTAAAVPTQAPRQDSPERPVGPEFSTPQAAQPIAPGTVAAPTTAAAPAAASMARTGAPPARRLNLYGELEETGPAAGSQLDGSTNLVQVSFATEGACVDPDIDSTGTFIAFASTIHRRTSDIYVKTVNGKTLTQITSDPADDVMPVFSPDAKSLAFASNRSGNWDIYLSSTSGGPPTQITSESDHELHPSWSPDGRSLAYCRFGTQSGRWEIWVTEVANPGVKRFLDYGVFPEWCPDVARNRIVFQRAKQRGSRDYSIWTIDVSNGQASQPTEIVSAANAALINPAWSPDGTRIVFVAVVEPQAEAARPRQSDVWIVNLDGSNRINLTNGQFSNFQPVWAADGSVYFVSDRSGIDNLWAVKAGPSPAGGGPMEKPQPIGVANADNTSSSGR